MWRLKNPGIFKGQWKVTARFTIELEDKVVMKCVRVSYFGKSTNIVKHFTQHRFLKLFDEVEKEVKKYCQ
jgi:hypothetical protein